MRPLIVHHANCPDGFGAAWLLGRQLGDHDKHAANWDEPPPSVIGRDVYIVDFCFRAVILQAMAEEATSLLVLDHHQTSADWMRDLHSIKLYDSLRSFWRSDEELIYAVVIDQTRSGVGLALEYCENVGPSWLANIEDRDLWKFDLPETPDVFAAVTSRPYTVEAWDEMSLMGRSALVTEGKAINRYREQLIASCVEDAVPCEFVGHKGWAAPAPYMIGSDVAGILAERGEFGAYWIDHPDHRQWGLRSIAPDGVDVAKIAEAFGGGGHRHASGLKSPLY